MKLWIVFFLILISFKSWAFELVVIQAVSESKKTFITRNGKRQGVQPGVTGTFTAEDVSLLAKARHVTGEFTQWELINADASLPFEKGAIVTYYPATEYIWALAPESVRKKFIKSQIPRQRRSMVFKGSLSRGLSESVSDAPASNPKRGGLMGEVYYERDFYHSLAFDIGLRYEQEVINYSGASLFTKRNLLLGNILYYFHFLKDYTEGARFFIGGGLGYGLSNTSSDSLSQSGPVSLLPGVKLGASFPFNDDWEFVVDGAFESLNTKEEQEDGKIQTTTQNNFKTGIGLRKFF